MAPCLLDVENDADKFLDLIDLYYCCVEFFFNKIVNKRNFLKMINLYYSTNFLLENKFQQTILHVVLKAGYYNKIVVHGDDSGFVNIKTIHALFRQRSF